MTRKILIAPSLLSADFSRLAEEIRDVEKAGCDLLHLDIMDGHFVPNLTIGPVVIQWIRKATKMLLDVHLMIEYPSQSIAEYRKAGADWITIHVEAEKNVSAALKSIRDMGAKAGLSLRPKTRVEVLEPFLNQINLVLVMSVEPGFGGQAFMPETMRKVVWLREKGFKGHVSVDGGIKPQTAPAALKAGADILVAG
ncbi:MAG: ribulose-phosphate 3-epimerase, partial [Omnitrophica bacterium GWA2_52_8]